MLAQITVFLGLIYPCIAACHVAIWHGSYSCDCRATGRPKKVSSGCTCTYSCDSGYVLSTPSDTDRYCSGRNWDDPKPSCTYSACDVRISDGSYDCGDCSTFGHPRKVASPCTCTYSCDSGYEISTPSDTDRYCSDGNWDDPKPSCTFSACPVRISHGSYDCGGCSTFGNPQKVASPCTCTYSCDSGYEMSTPGDTDRYCSSGSWDDPLPTCTYSVCSVGISHGSYDCGSCSTFGNPRKVAAPCTCTYSCDIGYELSTPSDTDRYCSGGSWDDALPSCTYSVCTVGILHGSHDCGGCSTFGNPTKVASPCTCTYTCDSGYEISTPSDIDRECSSPGNWDMAQPTCNAIRKYMKYKK